MDLHHVLEWALVGALMVGGIRQLARYRGSAGMVGNVVIGLLCVTAAGIAALAHRWPILLVTSSLMLLGVTTAWYLQGRANRRREWHLLAGVVLLMALFVAGYVMRGVPQDGIWPLLLQWAAIAVPAIAFAGYSMTVARNAAGSVRVTTTPNPIGILLSTTVLLSVLAGFQEIGGANCFYAAPLSTFLAAMLVLEHQEEERATSRDSLPVLTTDLSHSSRLAVVGELTASIAHEINQPLSAILSNADAADILLENAEASPDELRKIIWAVRRDALRASDVIRNVRTLAQKRDPDLIKLDLNTVVQSVVELLDQEMGRRRIGIVVTPFWKAVHVRGDQTLLVQVLINLVINAMDALEASRNLTDTPAPLPPIELKVSVSLYDEIHLRVVDQGSGIPKEQLEQLFNSFYTSKAHGMGLGLSISRSIVSAHGGRILATNNDGPGVTFHIFLPPYAEA